MGVDHLFHVAIRTRDLELSVRFYAQVMGLVAVPRPALDFPGAWLAAPGHEDAPLIHLYAGDAALPLDGVFTASSGVVDHVSIMSSNFYGLRERCAQLGLPWRENVLPTAGLWQLFVHDPSGVMLEFTFDASKEPAAEPVVSPERQYRAREQFFDPTAYA